MEPEYQQLPVVGIPNCLFGISGWISYCVLSASVSALTEDLLGSFMRMKWINNILRRKNARHTQKAWWIISPLKFSDPVSSILGTPPATSKQDAGSFHAEAAMIFLMFLLSARFSCLCQDLCASFTICRCLGLLPGWQSRSVDLEITEM